MGHYEGLIIFCKQGWFNILVLRFKFTLGDLNTDLGMLYDY